MKFNEVFAADDLRLKNGDLIYVEYEFESISNKIILLKKIVRADKFRVLAHENYRGRNVGADENAVYCGNAVMSGLDPGRQILNRKKRQSA